MNNSILNNSILNNTITGINGTPVYDTLTDELATLNCIFSAFTQICDLPYTDIYSHEKSMLYQLSSDYNIRFDDGRPAYLDKYTIAVAIGSTKDAQYERGVAFLENGCIDLAKHNFYQEYFYHHPCAITIMQCGSHSCAKNTMFKNGVWCKTCNGDLKHANQLGHFLKSHIEYMNIPRDSIIRIDKTTTCINFPLDGTDSTTPSLDADTLEIVRKLLLADKKKVAIMQTVIDNTEAKIKFIVNKMQVEKEYTENNLNNMLSVRGGSIDAYCKMLQQFGVK